MIRFAFFFAAFTLPHAAMAQGLTLPSNAVTTYQEAGAPNTLRVATGPWTPADQTFTTAEGTLTRSAFRIAASGLTPFQVLTPLQDQLTEIGYETLFTCAQDECGGFDFRFSLPVLPPPNMQIDLNNFRYWAGSNKTEDGTAYVTLLISQFGEAAYVQVDQVTHGENTTVVSTRGAPAPPEVAGLAPVPTTDLATELDTVGHAVLNGLEFATGSSKLADDTQPSLENLAEYLTQHPELAVAIVGHTDSSGSLAGNIDLSRQRANAVRQKLIQRYGVPSQQLTAQGMGYLAPIASNLTETGREANRRVEAVITSTN